MQPHVWLLTANLWHSFVRLRAGLPPILQHFSPLQNQARALGLHRRWVECPLECLGSVRERFIACGRSGLPRRPNGTHDDCIWMRIVPKFSTPTPNRVVQWPQRHEIARFRCGLSRSLPVRYLRTRQPGLRPSVPKQRIELMILSLLLCGASRQTILCRNFNMSEQAFLEHVK